LTPRGGENGWRATGAEAVNIPMMVMVVVVVMVVAVDDVAPCYFN
jgi:hypothetical protein